MAHGRKAVHPDTHPLSVSECTAQCLRGRSLVFFIFWVCQVFLCLGEFVLFCNFFLMMVIEESSPIKLHLNFIYLFFSTNRI